MRSFQHNALATVIRSLAAEKNPACLVDTQGTILFVNDAWERQAEANGGAPGCLRAALIGTSWLGHIRGDAVRQIHAALLERILRARGPHARSVTQVAESNTPTTAALVSARLEQVLQGGEPVAVSIAYATLRERPIDEVYELVDRPADAYRDAAGDIVQCSCCRRVRDPADPERWDFVPRLIAEPPPTVQAVCALCGELHLVPGAPAHARAHAA